MNYFKISDSFSIKTERLFVFAGDVIEGRAAPGMTFQVPEADHFWTLRVKSVERILKKGGDVVLGLVVDDRSPGYLPGLGVGWTAELVEDAEKELTDSSNGYMD